MLKKIELLIFRCHPKILPFIGGVFFFQIAFLGDDCDAALFPKGRICNYHAVMILWRAGKTIHSRLNGARIGIDAVEVEVHNCQSGGVWNDVCPVDESSFKMLFLIFIQILAVVMQYVIVGGDQKSSSATGRIVHRVLGTGLNDIHNALDQCSMGKILPGTLGRFSG